MKKSFAIILTLVVMLMAACNNSAKESTAEATTESTAESTTESTAESTTESTAESTTESTAEATTESTTESTTEATTEATTEPPEEEPTTVPPTTEPSEAKPGNADSAGETNIHKILTKYSGRWYLDGYSNVYVDIYKTEEGWLGIQATNFVFSVTKGNVVYPAGNDDHVGRLSGLGISPPVKYSLKANKIKFLNNAIYFDNDKFISTPAESTCQHLNAEIVPNDSEFYPIPTCTQEGYYMKWCPDCLKVWYEDVGAIGHRWNNATCTAPKTCTTCGAVKGSTLGHSWNNATCTAPKTCTICGATEGSAAGHSWKNATCTALKTCTICGTTEGNAAGHSWNNATCTAPKTCTICGATEGNAAGHSWNNATCTAPKTCKTCGTTEGSAAGHSWKDATCTAPKTCTICGATEGKSLGHSYTEESKTNGNNVGSVITYRCTLCGQTKQETIKPLAVSAYRSGSGIFNDWLTQVSYTINATGGYGKYQYKYEVYLTESSTSPALTDDFSERNRFGWSSRFYCNGNVLVITVKDEAGNNAKIRIVVDTEDRIG